MTKKEENLYDAMKAYTRLPVCIAFSGGVDSSLLLKLAADCAADRTQVYAVTFETELHPPCDLPVAQRVAKELGVTHKVIHLDELEEPLMKKNPENRCYLCKKMLFQKLTVFAKEVDASVILEGSNEDDLHVYRPGLQAVKELGVKSPLAEAGLLKAEVRSLAKELGLSVASRPSAPCLATRLPYGAELDKNLLVRISKGEEYLKQLGFEIVRLRLHGEIARIEIPQTEFQNFLFHGEEISRTLKELGFGYITLDMQGFRSGSMDEEILSRKNT